MKMKFAIQRPEGRPCPEDALISMAEIFTSAKYCVGPSKTDADRKRNYSGGRVRAAESSEE
jgi:hypothetical protein